MGIFNKKEGIIALDSERGMKKIELVILTLPKLRSWYRIGNLVYVDCLFQILKLNPFVRTFFIDCGIIKFGTACQYSLNVLLENVGRSRTQ